MKKRRIGLSSVVLGAAVAGLLAGPGLLTSCSSKDSQAGGAHRNGCNGPNGCGGANGCNGPNGCNGHTEQKKDEGKAGAPVK